MRPKGTAEELERRRLLAVRRLEEGYFPGEVARFGVTPQMPVTQPRERDQQAIDRWQATTWPAIQERAHSVGLTSC